LLRTILSKMAKIQNLGPQKHRSKELKLIL